MLSKAHSYFFTLWLGLLCSYSGMGQPGFNNYYPSGQYSFANKIYYVNNTEFLLSGYFQDSVSGQQGLDLKIINNQGTAVKHKRYLFGSREYTCFLTNSQLQASISNATMLFTAGSYVDTASAVMLLSVNKNTLDTNWTKYYYDGIYNYYVNNIFQVKPNEIWYMGTRGNNYGYTERPVVLKTDTMGNILAIKEFTNLINYEATCVHYDPNSGLLYIASNNVNVPSAWQSYVACMDTLGNVLWNQQIGSYPFYSGFYQLEQKNNYLVASGEIVSYVGTKHTMVKLNCSNGTIIWQKAYDDAGTGNVLKGFIINNDESIVVVGSHKTTINQPNYDGIIFKVDANGDSIWQKSYGNYGAFISEDFVDVQRSPDGGYVMCGSPITAPDTQAWVVKTDSLGNGPGQVFTGINALRNDEVFGLYPNPAKEKITITFSDQTAAEQAYQLWIYNSTGQLVQQEALSFKNKTATIKTSELPEGIYIVKLFSSPQQVFTNKLVIVK